MNSGAELLEPRDLKSINCKKITVVIVISNLEYGGAQRQVVELANNIDTDHFNLHICSLSAYIPLAESLKEKKKLHVVNKTFKFDVSVVFRLAKLLKELNTDIVHGYLFDAEIAARLAGRIAGIRAIGNSERNTNYHLKIRQLLTYRLTRNCVDFCIANSHAGAKFNQAVLKNPKESYYTIHNGVDTTRFYFRESEPLRKSLGLHSGHFVVGMFGSFKEQKNHPLLFNAMKRVLDQNKNCRILLVGDQLAGGMHGSDYYKKSIIDLTAQLDLEPYCVYAGNRDDVEELYTVCDVTALPSLYEGTPNVALESMASCVPVIATDVSDNAYIIRDGETGFVVPINDPELFADRLLLLAENPTRCKQMGHLARSWMEKEFSCSSLAQKTQSVYSDFMGQTVNLASRLKSFQD